MLLVLSLGPFFPEKFVQFQLESAFLAGRKLIKLFSLASESEYVRFHHGLSSFLMKTGNKLQFTQFKSGMKQIRNRVLPTMLCTTHMQIEV